MPEATWDRHCAACGRWPVRPLTVDAVVIRDGRILLIERGREPHRGKFALPGGFVDPDEDGATAALRELREETGLVGGRARLVWVADGPDRDPQRHAVALVYLVDVPAGAEPVAGDDAAGLGWYPLDDLPPLAFDHAEIIQQVRRAAGLTPGTGDRPA
ncbi:MAG TPA: NUDIX hydrolase [Dehalococcoidia bacterium]|nr:NUDIX hydrolase [Dehalococcoidia bacterium]